MWWSCNLRLGCGELDYRQQAQRIELKTGGMSVSPQIIPDTDDLDLYEQVLLFLHLLWISINMMHMRF